MQQITDKTFEKEVLKSDKPVIIDFWASWCFPCTQMAPIFEELSSEMKSIKFVKINVDDNKETPSDFNVMGIPTFIVFKNGKEVERIVGGNPKPLLKSKIEAALKK